MNNKNYTFFWGGVFSNFHPCSFTDSNGITYKSTEQFYMAHKALHFKDKFHYECIMKENNPKIIKKYGRLVLNFEERSWYGVGGDENPAKKYMYEGNYLKYTQNKKLQDHLLATEGTLLVEASPYDKIWGIGLSEDDLRSKVPKYWNGKNWLGEVLSQVRDDIIGKRLF